MALTQDERLSTVHGAVKANPADPLAVVLESLDDAKAEDVVAIDVTGKTPMTDHMVVASGRSHRHVGAVAERVMSDLKSSGVKQIKVEGLNSCDWVLIDAGDVIIHVFRPEVREFYSLEKMWHLDTAPHVELVV